MLRMFYFTLDGTKCIGKVVKIYDTKNIKMILFKPL